MKCEEVHVRYSGGGDQRHACMCVMLPLMLLACCCCCCLLLLMMMWERDVVDVFLDDVLAPLKHCLGAAEKLQTTLELP